MPFQLEISGRWRLTVIGREAAFGQRLVIRGSASGGGVHPGVVGSTLEVDGRGNLPWTLTIEHDDGTGIWARSEMRATPVVIRGSSMTFTVESEDLPGQANPDFNDLVVEAEKIGMFEVAWRPHAVRPDTMQLMPDGIFEAALGTYYMAVRLRNIWTRALPAGSLVGISALGRSVLAAGGIQVLDSWSTVELEAVGQEMSGGRVLVGAMEPWEQRTIYFKVDCTGARPRKHAVQFELVDPETLDPDAANRRAGHVLFASRTTYDPTRHEYVVACDRGRVSVRLREVAVELSTLRAAVACAREYRASHGDPADQRVRRLVERLLRGDRIDLGELRQALGGPAGRLGGEGDGEPSTDRWTCGDILLFPTRLDYRVEFAQPFDGQYGPLPYDDPWWKVLLFIVAIVLTAVAGISATMDLAYASDDVAIGTLFTSKLEPESDGRYMVDAALCKLNGNRDLPAVAPPLQVLDAQSGEDFTAPVDGLDATIELTGETLSNAEIDNLLHAFMADPDDPVALMGVRVFKSGARTGLTHAVMSGVQPMIRKGENGEPDLEFGDQLHFKPVPQPPAGAPPDPASGQAVSRKGDSGSLWVHLATRKIVALGHSGAADDTGSSGAGTRIQDVMRKLGIRFT